jgi:hypothetical protein
MPSPNMVPFGTTRRREHKVEQASACFFVGPDRLEACPTLPQLSHKELQEQQRGFGSLFVFGEVAQDAAFLLAAEGL